MLKYVFKFGLDILPSVVATIIGAYIVNHYIATKPAANAPVSASASTAEPKNADARTDSKPSEAAAATGSIREPGVKARGISEKGMLEKTAGEKPAVVEKPAVLEKPAVFEKPSEKSAEKPADTASIPVEKRRHQPSPREKAVARSVVAPIQPSTTAVTVAPVVSATNTVPQPESVVAPEDRRDANELARAAIERLRGASDASPRAKEPARVPETTGLVSGSPVPPPVMSPAPIRPLPPPIVVSTPSTETLPPAVADEPRRPSPPADIPTGSASSAPLDLRAESVQPQIRPHTSVAEEMLMAAKSVFHSVLPK
jgi:hypothetical protein